MNSKSAPYVNYKQLLTRESLRRTQIAYLPDEPSVPDPSGA